MPVDDIMNPENKEEERKTQSDNGPIIHHV